MIAREGPRSLDFCRHFCRRTKTNRGSWEPTVAHATGEIELEERILGQSGAAWSRLQAVFKTVARPASGSRVSSTHMHTRSVCEPHEIPLSRPHGMLFRCRASSIWAGRDTCPSGHRLCVLMQAGPLGPTHIAQQRSHPARTASR
jgi:hypothetical protein